MKNNFGHHILYTLRKIGNFFLKTEIGRVIGVLTTLVVFLQTIGVWEEILRTATDYLNLLKKYLLLSILGIPLYFWILTLFLLWWLRNQSKYLKLVSGEFFDDFKQGLSNWEFGNEGWKTEREDNEILLSVSESPDGGISKKGFSWTDYQFSFDMKLINKNAGWIVRAENRNQYLMIQFNLQEIKQPKLRLHLKIPPEGRRYQWVVLQEDIISQISFNRLKWIDVRIVVLGNNIDVYINEKHTAHYIIPDPIIWLEDYRQLIGHEQVKPSETEIKEKRPITLINASVAGRVGFRCYGDEHAHFRKVRVKPLF